jgi:hypothetical protein
VVSWLPGCESEKEREREDFAVFEMGRSWNGVQGEEGAVGKGRNDRNLGRIS